MKKIYSTGPFGEIYKISLDDVFLNRCKAIQKILRDNFNLEDGEWVEGYKKISGAYNRSAYVLIKPDYLGVGVFWEEGWETLTDEFDRITKGYVSIEGLPDIWFQDHLLWKFTPHCDFRSSFDKISLNDIDLEDIELFKKEVDRYTKFLDEEKKKLAVNEPKTKD